MDSVNQRFVLRLALLIEYLASEHPGIQLFGQRIRKLRNQVQHCALEKQGLYGVLKRYGNPEETFLEVWQEYPIAGQEWMLSEETTIEDALLVLLYTIKELKEHIYKDHEHSMNEHFQALGYSSEEQVTQFLFDEFDIFKTKSMMRKFKRWRAAYLGDTAHIDPLIVWRVKRLVEDKLRGRQSEEWDLVNFMVDKYDFDMEKNLEKKCKRFDSFTHRCGTKERKNQDAKENMIKFMEENVGVMTVPEKLSFASALNVLKDQFKMRHLENGLQDKMDFARRILNWQNGLFVSLIEYFVERDQKLYVYDPFKHPVYGTFFQEVLDLLHSEIGVTPDVS